MIPKVNLDKVSLKYPIYGVSAQSLKKRLLPFGGGNLTNNDNGIVIVSALKDISFSLHVGDSLGLIGRNGAGKSSLLRILAGIYAPSSGSISVNGNVVPLLDIGLGLDENSTGRQNIRLRGLLIGMSDKEIQNKAKDIIKFAELEKYIDLPLRTYSTGMRVRLAFSISTAIEAEILILDEVLGVGDGAFQIKAKRRLKEFSDRAKIMIHAIHDEETIRDTCNKVLWLDNGKIIRFGYTDKVLLEYKDFLNKNY